jgi:hypothetical protein
MTAADRQRGLRERQKALGRVRVSLWLDKTDTELLDDLQSLIACERSVVLGKALSALQRQVKPQAEPIQPYRRRRQVTKDPG